MASLGPIPQAVFARLLKGLGIFLLSYSAGYWTTSRPSLSESSRGAGSLESAPATGGSVVGMWRGVGVLLDLKPDGSYEKDFDGGYADDAGHYSLLWWGRI